MSRTIAQRIRLHASRVLDSVTDQAVAVVKGVDSVTKKRETSTPKAKFPAFGKAGLRDVPAYRGSTRAHCTSWPNRVRQSPAMM
ncbi:hypothetical protein [Mycetohabitans sp. B6]|uniref:hypothetical protein n=1 Tax=Mycetohabitans sp. B6 TaxID=2841843 RepID=UPI001F36E2AB|nr:hypothetical protein [Mycetohabitans sp. B6]MCG1047051.1 hypothetical protein [Mycetohabitans sp. B6]